MLSRRSMHSMNEKGKKIIYAYAHFHNLSNGVKMKSLKHNVFKNYLIKPS